VEGGAARPDGLAPDPTAVSLHDALADGEPDPGAAVLILAVQALEHADRVFGMFERLHGEDQYSGTGIGLAICKRIVERHGGRIWCEPVRTGGTAFHFTLPGE